MRNKTLYTYTMKDSHGMPRSIVWNGIREDAVRLSQEEAEAVAAYLETAGKQHHSINVQELEGNTIVCNSSTSLNDGIWCWDSEDAHLIRTQRISPGPTFMAYLSLRNYTPAVSAKEARRLRKFVKASAYRPDAFIPGAL